MRTIWKVMMIIGLLPFIVPLAMGLYTMMIETWELLDWLLFWSVIYWPTYVVGIVLIIIALYKLRSTK